MAVRKMLGQMASKKPWLVEVYPQGRDGPRKRKFFATKGEALAWEKHMLAQPWQQPEKVSGDLRRLSDLVALWYGRHGQTLTDGDRRRDKLNWLAEALDNPLATEFSAQQFAAYRERRLAGELYVPGQRKQVSPTTINRELLYLQAVFNELGRLGEWTHGTPWKCCASTRCKNPSWRSSIRMKSSSCWQPAQV